MCAKFGSDGVAGLQHPRTTRRSSDPRPDSSTRQTHHTILFSPGRPRARPCQGLGRLLFRQIRSEEGCGSSAGTQELPSRPPHTCLVDAPKETHDPVLTRAPTCPAMPRPSHAPVPPHVCQIRFRRRRRPSTPSHYTTLFRSQTGLVDAPNASHDPVLTRATTCSAMPRSRLPSFPPNSFRRGVRILGGHAGTPITPTPHLPRRRSKRNTRSCSHPGPHVPGHAKA